MTKNPFLNAVAASLYIVLVVAVMSVGTRIAPPKDSFLAPIAMISLFTLSAAVMAYIFCYQPILLYFDGKKKQATTLFLQTVGIFGGITALLMVAAFSGIFPYGK